MATYQSFLSKIARRSIIGFVRPPSSKAPVADKRRRGIAASLEEGIYSQIWLTLTGGKFLVDLALLFGATAIHLGLINALPFLAATSQLLGAYMVSRIGSRKRVMIPTAFITREIFWFILILIALPIERSQKLWLFILLLAVSSIMGQMGGNTWLSWISDLIPDQLRGRVISLRNGVLIIVALGADFIFSRIREGFGEDRREAYLMLCLGVAAFFGLKSIFVFKNQWEPPYRPAPIPALREILRKSFAVPAIRQLLFALALWNAAVGVAISFWTPHMIVNLKMSFTSIFFYTLIATVFSFFMSRFIWGPVIDRAGTLTVVIFCSAMISAIPIFWLFITADDLTVLWFEAVMNGLVWSGFNIAIFNLPFRLLPRENRAYFLAILASISGLALGVGAIAGGIIAQSLESMHVEIFGVTYINYHVTFVLSAIMRACCVFVLRKIPDTHRRGMIFMFQVIGDGLVRIMTNPLLILVSGAPAIRKRKKAFGGVKGVKPQR